LGPVCATGRDVAVASPKAPDERHVHCDRRAHIGPNMNLNYCSYHNDY